MIVHVTVTELDFWQRPVKRIQLKMAALLTQNEVFSVVKHFLRIFAMQNYQFYIDYINKQLKQHK